MKPYMHSHWLWAGIACLVMVSAPAAASSNYLEGKTYYQDPAEVPRMPPGTGDYAEDYVYTGNLNVGPEEARRQRVETRVKSYMESLSHSHDDSEPQVTPEIFNNLSARAQAGDAKAMSGMGYAYQHGLGTQKNEKLAVEWYKAAIDRGEIQHHSTIGDMYRDYSAGEKKSLLGGFRNMLSGGDDGALERSNEEARKWYEKGIYHPEDWRSYVALGEMYRDGTGGLEKDMTKANTYYDRGMSIKKRLDLKKEREVRREARRIAEEEEGMNDVPKPQNLQGETQEEVVQSDPAQTIVLDGVTCSYQSTMMTRRDYTNLFNVSCPGMRGKELGVKKVAMPGLQCDVQRVNAGDATHMLLCNPEEETGVAIGGSTCQLRTEPEQSGYTAVYGAYCGGKPEEGLTDVTLRGMRCEVTPAGSRDGKTYTLRCGKAASAEAGEQEERSVRARIGTHNCSLRQIESPSNAYKFLYEAYCGGLSEGEKSSGAIPGSVSVGVNLCNVQAWPDNDSGKDFELYCR